METKFYVYVYIDPSKKGLYSYDGLDFSFLYEPFYIGKGHNNRIITHLQEYRLKRKNLMSNKLNKIIKLGYDPIVFKLYENLTEQESFDKEIFLIDKIGKRIYNEGPLANLVDGGGGVSGLIHTKESRKKMSLKGDKHPNWGKKLKESTKEKISERLKLNNPMKNPIVSEKVRLKNLGRKPWNKDSKEKRDYVIKKLSEKKIKYRNIKAISKKTGEIFEFENTNEVMSFINKTHRMIMIYFKKGESKEYYWTFTFPNFCK
jgi:group I intron endonuclease